MKSLIVMRHAKSDWSTGSEDKLRPLNARGRAAAPRMADWLQLERCWPELLLISTSTRTRETWELMNAKPRPETVVKWEDSLYLAPVDRIWKLVCQRWAEHPHVNLLMVLAHNPGIENFMSSLARRLVEAPTAAVAVFGFEEIPVADQYCDAIFLSHQIPRDLPD